MDCSENKCLCPTACNILDECVMGHELAQKYPVKFKETVMQSKEEQRIGKIIELFQALKPPKVSGFKIGRYFGLRNWESINLDKDGAPKRHLKKQATYLDKENNDKIADTISDLIGEQPETWTVMLLKDGLWRLEKRFYRGKKFVTDFDLYDIEDKRMNATRIFPPLNKDYPVRKKKEKKPSLVKAHLDKKKSLSEYNSWAGKNNATVDKYNSSLPKETLVQKKIRQYNMTGKLSEMEKEILEYQMYLQRQTPEQFKIARQHGWRIAKMLTEPEPNFHYE